MCRIQQVHHNLGFIVPLELDEDIRGSLEWTAAK